MPHSNTKTQFAKFCTVGVSGTLVDFITLNLLTSQNLSLPIAGTLSFLAAVINNYLWNSRWTFKQTRTPKQRAIQLLQFTLVSTLGLLIRIPILLISTWIPTKPLEQILQIEPTSATVLINNLALSLSILIVLIWNFLANKFWTFKPERPQIQKPIDQT